MLMLGALCLEFQVYIRAGGTCTLGPLVDTSFIAGE